MTQNDWLSEGYYQWLASEAFAQGRDRKEYEKVLRILHDIPFYWTLWSDENRAGDALSFRQYEFLKFQDNLETLDQVWLGIWATATPSVLEVLLGMARRWTYYFAEAEPCDYFGIMFGNLGLAKFPGAFSSAKAERVRTIADDWMSRQFQPNGIGSPFPVKYAMDVVDMTKLDIWGQMNAYSAEHFQ